MVTICYGVLTETVHERLFYNCTWILMFKGRRSAERRSRGTARFARYLAHTHPLGTAASSLRAKVLVSTVVHAASLLFPAVTLYSTSLQIQLDEWQCKGCAHCSISTYPEALQGRASLAQKPSFAGLFTHALVVNSPDRRLLKALQGETRVRVQVSMLFSREIKWCQVENGVSGREAM